MSKTEQKAYPVIEWSPTGVTLYDPVSKSKHEATTIAQIAPLLKGGKEVVVALSRRTSFVRTVHLPNAAKDDVARILQLQIGQLVPIQASDVASDFFFTDHVGSEGRLAVVAAAQAELLRQLNTELSESGLSSVAVVPAALGSSLLAAKLGETECAIVQHSHEGICIDILSQGELRASRVVPMSNPELIEGEICRSFSLAKLPCADSIGAGGFSFPGVGRTTDLNTLSFLGQVPLSLNLELPEILARRVHQKVEKSKRLAMLLWVAALGVGAVIWDIRSSAMDVVAKSDKKWNVVFKNLNGTKSQAEGKLNTLTKTNTALATAFQPKQRFGDVLAIISGMSPPDLWLTGITLERGKPAQFRGTATNGDAVSLFLTSLSGEARFRDAKLIFANNGTIESTSVVQFSISTHLVGNFPAFEPEDKKKK